MAQVYHYEHLFEVPRAKRPVRPAPRVHEPADLIDLEFSDYGRNPRFRAGWFILPAVVTGMAIIAALALLV